MHGWDLNVKEKKECWNASVVIIQICDTEKAKESHICIIGTASDLLFCLGSPAISTILKVINFYEEFTPTSSSNARMVDAK